MIEPEYPERHAGSVVIVTGSTRGIGRGIANRFLAEGASVVCNGRSETDVKELVPDEMDEAKFIRADLSDPEQGRGLIESTAEQWGRIDVLVNNAAVQTETAADDLELSDWERVVETDFRAYWLCAKHAAQHMDPGSIVNVSSNHAFQTMPNHFPYNAVKSGIDGMTRAMALDLGPNIRVNTVNPGWIAVERTTNNMDGNERQSLESIHPVGRLGTPDDVARVVSFLASETAGFITGSSIVVDGGRSAVLQDDTLPDYRERRDSSVAR